MRKRILGEIHELDIDFIDTKILYVTQEQYLSEDGRRYIHNPSFWMLVKGVLYYAICDYEFDFLETYSDWELDGVFFNNFFPSDAELHHLLNLNPTFYGVNEELVELFDDEFCENELNIVRNHTS